MILFLSTCLNAIITVYGTRRFGYFAAAIGTAGSLIIGVIVCINIYYQYKLKFNMVKVYGEIIGKTWIPLFIAAGIVFLTKQFLYGGWGNFIINVIIFCVSYIIVFWMFVLTKEKRKKFYEKIRKKG